MNFQDCITQCIECASASSRYSHLVPLLESYPVPTDKEWEECVQEVQGLPCEDAENPWRYLERYDLRLSGLGFVTVLDLVAAEALAACKAAGWSPKELPALLMSNPEKEILIDEIAKVVRRLVAKAKCN